MSMAVWTRRLGALEVGDALAVGDGLAAGGDDLVGDLLGRRGVGARAVDAAAEVVDHDLGPVAGQAQGVLAPDATAGTRHDGHAALDQLRHRGTLLVSIGGPDTRQSPGGTPPTGRSLLGHGSVRGGHDRRRRRRRRPGRRGGGGDAGPGRAGGRRGRQGPLPARQVLRRRADDAGAAGARGAGVRPAVGGRLAGRRRRRAAVAVGPPGHRARCRRTPARTPPSPPAASSTPRSSTWPSRPASTSVDGHGLRRPTRASRTTTSCVGVDGPPPHRRPLRRRRRRDVEPGAAGRRSGRARLPRRVARLPGLRRRRQRAGRRPPLRVVRRRPAARVRVVVPAARRAGQRRLRRPARRRSGGSRRCGSCGPACWTGPTSARALGPAAEPSRAATRRGRSRRGSTGCR